MTGFPSGIVRPLGFASKADAGELPRGPVEADAFALHRRLTRLFFRHQGAPPLSVTSHVIPEPFTPALPAEVAQWSLTTLREKLVKIGAKVVRHGRSIVFQMAEVAVPRSPFAEVLRLID